MQFVDLCSTEFKMNLSLIREEGRVKSAHVTIGE
jgi:hypothetical protein